MGSRRRDEALGEQQGGRSGKAGWGIWGFFYSLSMFFNGVCFIIITIIIMMIIIIIIIIIIIYIYILLLL